MYEINPVYEKLFQDEEVFKIVSKLHSTIWQKLTIEEKQQVFKDLEIETARVFEEKPIEVIFDNNLLIDGRPIEGKFSKNQIYINENFLENQFSQYNVLNTFFHERRHKFQHDAFNKELADDIYVYEDKKKVELWKRNNFRPLNFTYKSNYVYGPNLLYFAQPLEADAFEVGDYVTIRFAKEIEKKLGKDKMVANYLMVDLLSGRHVYKEKESILKKELLEIWEENEKFYKIYQEKIASMKEKLGNLNELDDSELYNLFSEFFWVGLTLPEKAKILKQLDKKEAKNEKRHRLDIKVNEKKKELTINGKKIMDTFAGYALNDYYSVAFEDEVVEKMCNFNKDVSKYTDLELNLYLNEEGERINFYENEEHPFLYLFQPFCYYESIYISDKLKRIKPFLTNKIEDENFYQIDFWNYLINQYDFEKIALMIQDFTGENYKDMHSKMMDKMRKNIEKSQNIVR